MYKGMLSKSYFSLNEADALPVYQSTTIPKKNFKQLLMHGPKKAIKEVSTQVHPNQPKKMVAQNVNTEEAALLSMDDIELKNIQLQIPNGRGFNVEGCTEVRVRTDRRDIVVAVQGTRSKPVIITYHDLGLNSTSLTTFFNFAEMRVVLENFCVLHVSAPGQEEGAQTLPEDYAYPTMDELANQLNYVLAHFGIKSFIGFGVGAGANIMARMAINHPEKMDAVVLINCSSTQGGWLEWACQKINARVMKKSGITVSVNECLMWHHFGRKPEERNSDLATMYRTYFARDTNPHNLSLFMDSFVRRTDLNIARDSHTIKVPVLNMTGALSPHVNDTVTFNGRLNPNNSTWMKISDCGLVLDEQPGKVAEAFRLFIQGEGLVAPLSPTKSMSFVRVSETSGRRACRHSPVIRITENPISETVVC